jgi:ferredoxin
MIVAERKPFDEILEMLKPYRRVLVLGCGGCVTVCLTGGEKQAEELASQLRLAAKTKGLDLEVDFDSITRQCDEEFIENLTKDPNEYDVVLSIACGVGVQFMAERFDKQPWLPGLNTTFYGANTAPGMWEEYCYGCGDCILHLTGGICPIARCSKSLVNGACGGTNEGKCEVNPEMDCGWELIYKRLKESGNLEELAKIREPRDWRKERGAGVRRMTVEQMIEQEQD